MRGLGALLPSQMANSSDNSIKINYAGAGGWEKKIDCERRLLVGSLRVSTTLFSVLQCGGGNVAAHLTYRSHRVHRAQYKFDILFNL